jgi:hypothetical protein
MVEHLHDGQRIADFVGDLGREQAEGGEFFVLTQLLLDIHDALVEAGLFHGDGRQFRQGAQNVDFLVGKTARLAGIDIERADGLPAKNQRRAQQRNQPFAPRHVHVLIKGRGWTFSSCIGFLRRKTMPRKLSPRLSLGLLR